MDNKAVSDFLMGDEITGFYVLRRADLKSRRDKKGYFLAIEISDASGRMSGNVWEGAEKIAQQVQAGDVIKLSAQVQSYQGNKQLSVQRLRKATAKDGIELASLVPAAGEEISKIWREYKQIADSIVNPFLRSLLRKFTDDEKFRTAFCEAPGGKQWHHGYRGGLLEHTVGVTRVCRRLAGIYPDIDQDLLLAAALLHDIGKIESYEHGPTFDYTDAGRLVGHIVLGSDMVLAKIAEIPAFPDSLRTKLQHLILSHQGKLEHASPVVPMMAEGLLLYHADEIDSKLNAFNRIKKREHKEDVRWSSWVRLMGQHFYFGEKE